MNRFAAALLATTSLSALATRAAAAIVFENVTPFGSALTNPTIVPLGNTLYVGNEGQSAASYFVIPEQSLAEKVQIQFTAARIGLLAGVDQVPIDHFGEGGSLPTYPGTPTVTLYGTPPPNVTALLGSYAGSSYPSNLQPVLGLFSLTSATYTTEGMSEGHGLPAIFAQVTPPAFSSYAEGGGFVSDSYTVDLTLPAGLALPLSFAYDYDYTLDIQVSQVPEPATAALLGLGLAGLAVARRRRRTSII